MIPDIVPCDYEACQVNINGYRVQIIEQFSALEEACGDSDISIMGKRIIGPRLRRQCEAILLDQRDLEPHGAVDIYFNTSFKRE